MKLKLYDKVIFRVPQFPVDTTLEACWDELKASIAIASEGFHKLIEHADYADYDTLPPEVKVTVQKYYNRARFRATPYGTFAGFGVCGTVPADTDLRISTINRVHAFTDWKYCPKTDKDIWEVPPEELCLQSNSTHYRVDDSIRYVSSGGDREGTFCLTDIPYTDTLMDVLNACMQPITAQSLMEKLDADKPTCYGWIAELVEAELLYTHLQPNIIGKDYFTRVGYPSDNHRDRYLITERQHTGGGLGYSLCRQLAQLIPLLHAFRPEPRMPEHLETFISRFTAKYDQIAVPLMLALDPEVGIGYGDLENPQSEDGLIPELVHKRQRIHGSSDDILKRFLAEKLAPQMGSKSIDLDGLAMPFQPARSKLPNSLSAMASVYDGTLLVEHIGGCTANALLGRFTLTEGDVWSMGRDIAAMEQRANPDVLFFDVGYMGEPSVDNVNRRQAIYSTQLAILNFDTSCASLSLGDIHVAVRGGEMVLFSKKLGKRLVPRIATAYNHIRSDLSVFRFLHDLQSQGLCANLSFDIEQLYPGLHKYPEVRHRDIILSPAKWKLSLDRVETDTSIASFRQYLSDIGTSQYIKVGMADQTLLLDTDDMQDMEVLHSTLKKRKELWAQQVPGQESHPIHDEAGRLYRGEFVLTYHHDVELYKGLADIHDHRPTAQQRVFIPGSEWLYAELHCHPLRTDELLTGELASVLGTCSDHITKWFFIRYNEGGEHVRFRLHLRDRQFAGKIMAEISDSLQGKVNSGLVSAVQYKPYRRELERYAHAGMDAVENHFHADSCYVLGLLEAGIPEEARYGLCVQLFRDLRASVELDGMDFDDIAGKMCRSYSVEHHMDGTAYKRVNGHYRNFRTNTVTPLPDGLLQNRQHFLLSFAALLRACAGHQRQQLFADLYHMHINRLFPQYQRTHELLVYYYLEKDSLRERKVQPVD